MKSSGSAPVIQGYKPNVHQQAMLEKLVSDPNQKGRVTPTGQLTKILKSQSQKMIDARNVEQISPDLTRVANIVISSMIAPNDLISSKLNYTMNDSALPIDLQQKLIDYVQEFFDKKYKINDIHKNVLKKALFTDGSVPMAVIPESSIDELINGAQVSNESLPAKFKKALDNSGSLLGAPSTESKMFRTIQVDKTGSVENHGKTKPMKLSSLEGAFVVSDNLDILKIGHHNRNYKSGEIAKRYASTESLTFKGKTDGTENNEEEVQLTRADIASMFYTRYTPTRDGSLTVKTAEDIDRATKGHPLVMSLPHDSVVPVYVPGDVKQHFGYYVLLGEDGYPVSRSNTAKQLEKTSGFKDISDTSSSMLEEIKNDMNISDLDIKSEIGFDELRSKFRDNVVSNLTSRLANGKYGHNVELPEIHNAYSIMLSRAMEQRRTQVLFIPAELMTYIAFDYDENGIGLSLHEKNKVLNNIRSTLSFANTMGAINNSINKKNINITIDPEDDDPDGSVIALLSNVYRQEEDCYPLDKSNPHDLYRAVSMSGTNITVEGHPDLSNSKVEIENIRTDNTSVDTDIYEKYKEEVYLAYDVVPEMLLSSASSDFAIDTIQRNILFNQSTVLKQEIYNGLLTDHGKKYMVNSGTVMKDLIEIIVSHQQAKDTEVEEQYENITGKEMDDEVSLSDMSVADCIQDFLLSIEFKLPAVDSNELKSQAEIFDIASQAVETYVDKMLPTSKLQLLYGEENRDKPDAIRDIYKSYLLRKFMIKNNIFTEFLDATGDEPDTIKDIESELKSSSGFANAVATALNKIQEVVDGATAGNDNNSDQVYP